MTIQFMCPNGHTLTAPDHHAGKEGKCPKCESEFLVPELEEFAQTQGEPPPEIAATESHDGNTPSPTAETIVFLCPNGHKLSGPATLQGKPGQCPHCNSKFVIPDEHEEDEVAEHELADDDDDEVVPLGKPIDASSIIQEQPIEEISDADIVDDPIAPPIDGAHQLGAIFYQLNAVLDEDRLIELQLQDGDIIVANKISLTLSQSDYAVLARIDDDDDETSIITVPWSTVKRATIRKVTELPDGWFR